MSQLRLLGDPDKRVPRWYQSEAHERVNVSLQQNRSTLVAMATGLGKTALFAWVVKEWLERGKSVLVLAHTEELVQQNQRTLESVTGETCYIEQSKDTAPRYARLVSGSFQSVTQDNRLNRLGRDRFDLVVVDEAHHSTAPTYKRVLEWFETAKILGVTATPDRGDEKALGKVYDDVAYVMDILDGIDAGYLVPIRALNVDIQEVDLSGVKVTGGDFAKGELDEAILQGVEGIVQKTLELHEGRFGILFFPGVLSAEAAALRFNELQPGCAAFVHGGTPREERRAIFDRFRRKEFLFLCNCMIATEGFDAPHVSFIGMGRPTKSRALATQMAGRGTRVLPGLVDHLPTKDAAGRRKLAIRCSHKPDMLLMNFVGNGGRHTLSIVEPEDILGGDFSDDEIAAAKRLSKAKEGGGEKSDPLAALREAREQLKRAVSVPRGRVVAHVSEFNPFDVLDVDLGEDRISSRYGTKLPTEKQLSMLEGRGLDKRAIKTLDRRQASKMIDALLGRQSQGLASLKQMKLLSSYGVTDKTVTFENASKAITYIKGKGWGKRGPLDQAVLNDLLGRS